MKRNRLIYNTDLVDTVSTSQLQGLIPIKKAIEKSKTLEKILIRIIDILGGVCGVTLLVPLTIAIYIANMIGKDKGKLFYTQERIGKDGKIFKLYKFRSMVEGADEKLFEYLKENEVARHEYEEYKKLKEDPRITKVGHFIRKTSLDEFPQFINVLKGDMSLVGPRPYLPREVEDMNSFYEYIIKSKPGITGPWQIGGRNEITFRQRMYMDVEYYYNNNFYLYIKLLIKTFFKIIKKEGAI